MVRQYARKVGIEKLAPHDLRRTCARLCHQAGGELDQIQFLLGHVCRQLNDILAASADPQRRQRPNRHPAQMPIGSDPQWTGCRQSGTNSESKRWAVSIFENRFRLNSEVLMLHKFRSNGRQVIFTVRASCSFNRTLPRWPCYRPPSTEGTRHLTTKLSSWSVVRQRHSKAL